jgi:hypothetical protein
MSTKEGQVGASCSAEDRSDSSNWSCSLDYSGLQPHIADVTAIHANYLSAANTANTSYQTYAATAKLLEEQIKRCNTFFETTSAEEMYDFDPDVSFRYNQIYRDDDGSSVLSTIEIGYKETPGCVITKSLGGPSTYDGGMDTAAARYSSIYKEGELITIDFANTSLSRAESATGYQTFLDTEYDAPKVFTHDAKYIATCEWEEDENEIHTLVPTGAAEETSASNFTRHGYEYKVYLTTYQGTYETDWSANNIGENGKFDNFIRDNGGSTCAGNTPTNSSMFTCTLTVEYEIIYVGKCNGVTVDTGDCDPVSNVDGLFQFKVVDPSDIFPTGTTTDSGKAIAKNWTDTAEGQQVKNEIETRGKKGETYSHDRLTYQFNLTPATMRHIKNYNTSRNTNNIGGYSDFNMTCSCPSNVQTDTLKSGGVGCTQCKSNLLTDLANNQITYNNHTYTGLNVWDSTKNIQEVRNSVWG